MSQYMHEVPDALLRIAFALLHRIGFERPLLLLCLFGIAAGMIGWLARTRSLREPAALLVLAGTGLTLYACDSASLFMRLTIHLINDMQQVLRFLL